jgi:hypothetical protein
MQQMRNSKPNKKASDLERFLICNNYMVRVLDYRWNRLYSSLHLMQERLATLGVVVVNGEICYFEGREGRNA